MPEPVVTATYGPTRPADGTWEALSRHPSEMRYVMVVGVSQAAVVAAFPAEWSGQTGQQVDPDEVEFLRTVRVRARLSCRPDGWRAQATGEAQVTAEAQDRRDCEDAFVDAWNTATGADFAPEEFAFDRVG